MKEGVRQAYSSEIPNGKLDIFCVSNTVYEKYCRKGVREYVNASGIVELRSFCHGITAEAQLREARHYLHSSLGSLLNSLGLWAGSRLPDLEVPVVVFSASIEGSLEAAKEKVNLAPATCQDVAPRADGLRRHSSPSPSFDKTSPSPLMSLSQAS